MIDPRIETGIPGLDEVLGGGLPQDRLYLVQGEPGVGKTTLALQFLLEGVAAGEPVLYVTLSESREEIEQVARSHGWTLDGITLYELTTMEDYLDFAADNSVFHPAEVELEETTKAILKLVNQVKPRRAVFDSLSEMRMLARDSLRYRRQILALKHFFAGQHCTVFLLDDKTSEPTDLQLQSICHGVIQLEQTSSGFGVDRRRMRVQKLRGVSFKSGFHDFGIQKGGLCVYPRLVASEHRHQIPEEVISSGVSGLDSMLGGGLDKGVSTLLLGASGSGKSSVAVLYAIAAAKRGERAIMYSFEESPRTLYKRTRALGMNLEAHVEAGSIRIQYIDPAELSPGEFTEQVRRDTSSGEVTVAVIDSLNGFLNAMPNERYLVLQLHELLAFLGQQGVTCILVVAQHGMLGSNIATPVDVSYLADTVILFRYYENEGKIKRAITVVKRRGGVHDEAIRELSFGADKGGIYVGESLHKLRGILTGVPISERGIETSG